MKSDKWLIRKDLWKNLKRTLKSFRWKQETKHLKASDVQTSTNKETE